MERELPKGTRVVVRKLKHLEQHAGVVDGYRLNFLSGQRELALVPDSAPGMLAFYPLETHTIREEGALL